MQPQNETNATQSIPEVIHNLVDHMSSHSVAQNYRILNQQERLRAVHRHVNAALCSNDPDYIRLMLLEIQKRCQS
jgi:hypothetical protein